MFCCRGSLPGLLSGNDIRRAIKDIDGEMLLLPPDIINGEGYFLDGIHIDKLRDHIKMEIIVSPYRLKELGAVL